jgi:hypothetical protein
MIQQKADHNSISKKLWFFDEAIFRPHISMPGKLIYSLANPDFGLFSFFSISCFCSAQFDDANFMLKRTTNTNELTSTVPQKLKLQVTVLLVCITITSVQYYNLKLFHAYNITSLDYYMSTYIFTRVSTSLQEHLQFYKSTHFITRVPKLLQE